MSRGHIGRDKAEDFVMDALVKLARLQTLAGNPQALLVTTALNLLYSTHRREAGRFRGFAILHDPDDDLYRPADERVAGPGEDVVTELAEAEEVDLQTQALRAGLEQLPASDRALLQSYYFESHTPLAMDSEAGERPGTAKLRIHRARERLRAIVNASLTSKGPSR